MLERDEARAAYQRLLDTAAASTRVAEAAATWWRGEIETAEFENHLRALLGGGSPKHTICPDCPIP